MYTVERSPLGCVTARSLLPVTMVGSMPGRRERHTFTILETAEEHGWHPVDNERGLARSDTPGAARRGQGDLARDLVDDPTRREGRSERDIRRVGTRDLGREASRIELAWRDRPEAMTDRGGEAPLGQSAERPARRARRDTQRCRGLARRDHRRAQLAKRGVDGRRAHRSSSARRKSSRAVTRSTMSCQASSVPRTSTTSSSR